jgi:ubiquinone/menaquinone biosynthesis C-methylase UbiE
MAIETGAQVIGIDAAPGLLEIARKRNPQNNFLEEDLELLPFSKNTFDVVTGFNSFQYAGNFLDALLEAKRVLKTGGRLVIAIWDKPEASDATIVLKAIGSLLPPPPVGTPGPFALSEDGKIESIFEAVGLKMISKSKVVCPFLYKNIGSGIKSFIGTGPAAAAIKKTDIITVEETIAKALRPFRITEDLHYLQNQFLLFVAEK